MSGKQGIRHRPLTRSPLSILSQENAEEKIYANFLRCSIEEEDLLDNIEPSLVSAALTDSCSSHFSSEFRSYDDRFELSSADPSNENGTVLSDHIVCDHLGQSLEEKQELKTCSNRNSIPAVPRRSASHTHRPTSRPSPVNLCDDPVCSHDSRSKLSLSMHDISKIPAFPLVGLSKQSNLSSETIQSQSITTVGSCPKSKDSGFPRSLSCLSLNSGKSYEHIQSKVKDYIKQIKAGNKIKRKLTYESSTNESTCCKVGDQTYGEATSPKILVPIINKLKDELDEKDRMLLKLQENYDTLLMKYAAAENRIDHLRVNSVGNAFNVTLPDYKKPKASPNMLLLSNLCHLQKESNVLEMREKYKSETSSQPTMTGLRPRFTNLNSNNLVNAVGDGGKQLLFNSSAVIGKEKNERCSLHQSHNSSCKSQHIEIESRSIENAANRECTNEHHALPHSENIQLPTQPLIHQLENPFVKVKRWQESLPSLHLIEPSLYDQFIGIDAGKGSEEFHNIETHQTASYQTGKDGVVLSANRNLPPLDPTPTLVVSSPNATATDLDDLSCQPSQCKGTKHVCQNPNSVATSLDSSSTFICLENASSGNQSTSGQEPMTCIDSSCIEANNNIQNKDKWTPHFLSPIIAPLLHKNHLPTLPKIQPIAKQLFSPESTKKLLPFLHQDITKENGDSNDILCRKRLLGQRARLLLMLYMNNSASTSSQISMENRDSFEAKNESLVQCLDEMNQCAQKLRGKSEAIMEVLAKQLKDTS